MFQDAENLSDEELVRQALTTNNDAIFRRYRRQLYVHVRARVGTQRIHVDQCDIDDIVQTTLEKAWRSLPTLENPAAFKSWLLRIGERAVLDYFRRRKRWAWLHPWQHVREEVEPISLEEPELLVETIDLIEQAAENIKAQLSSQQQRCLYLLCQQGYGVEAIAAELHLSVPSAKVYCSKALSALHKEMKRLHQRNEED